MQIFGFKITRASTKELEDITLGIFNPDGTVNLPGLAMGFINVRNHLGKIDGKLLVITALIILQMSVQFPFVKAILAPAAMFGQAVVTFVGSEIRAEIEVFEEVTKL